MATAKIGLEELCECPVCCITDGDLKQLPCGHTCCAGCLQTIWKKDKGTSTKDEEQSSHTTIQCPLCNVYVTLPDGITENLPTHLMMKQLRYMVNNKTNGDHTPCQVCKHDGCRADMFCKDCKTGMCTGCAEKHMLRQIFDDHTVVAKAIAVCNLHDNQFLHFCKGCSIFLCITCLNDGVCERHDVVTIESIIPSKRKDIDKVITKVADIVEFITSNMPTDEDIRSKVNMTENLKQQIKDHTDHLMQMIGLRRIQLLKLVDQWHTKFVEVEKTSDAKDNLKALNMLHECALNAKEQSDELLILVISAIKSRIYQVKLPTEVIKTSIQFDKSDSSELGKLAVKFTGELDFTKPPLLKASVFKDNVIELQNASSVHFLLDESFVVCEYDSKEVKKYNLTGQLLTTSKSQHVFFHGNPVGMACDWRSRELLVADETKKLIFLNMADLKWTSTLTLEDGCKAKDVAILTDTLLVLHKDGFNHYTRQGKLLTKVLKYGSKQFKTISTQFIGVIPAGMIMVSSINPEQIILFDLLHGQENATAPIIEYFKTIDMRACGHPGQACTTRQNTILVPCSSASKMPCIIQLSEDRDPQILSTLILPFTDDDHTRYGAFLSVAIKGSLLAVLFQKCLRLYHLNTK